MWNKCKLRFLTYISFFAYSWVDYGIESSEGYSYGSLIYENESYSIGVPSALYKELLPIVKDEKETEISELIYKKIDSKEMYFFELISNKSKEKDYKYHYL